MIFIDICFIDINHAMIQSVLEDTRGYKESFFMNNQNKPKTATASAVKKQKWSRKKKIWVIVGAIITIIIVLVIITNIATSAPSKVSNELVSDIQAKNATGAYGLLSSDAQKVVPASQLKQTVDQIGPILSGTLKMISKEINGQTGSAATAKVVYEIKGNDGITYKFTVNLTKENGQWKVLNFDSSKK